MFCEICNKDYGEIYSVFGNHLRIKMCVKCRPLYDKNVDLENTQKILDDLNDLKIQREVIEVVYCGTGEKNYPIVLRQIRELAQKEKTLLLVGFEAHKQIVKKTREEINGASKTS